MPRREEFPRPSHALCREENSIKRLIAQYFLWFTEAHLVRSSARKSSSCLAFAKKKDIDRDVAEYFRVARIERPPAVLPLPRYEQTDTSVAERIMRQKKLEAAKSIRDSADANDRPLQTLYR